MKIARASIPIAACAALALAVAVPALAHAPVTSRYPKPTARKTAVRATFSRPLPSGSYSVTWRALASDSHRQAGSWSFRVR